MSTVSTASARLSTNPDHPPLATEDQHRNGHHMTDWLYDPLEAMARPRRPYTIDNIQLTMQNSTWTKNPSNSTMVGWCGNR